MNLCCKSTNEVLNKCYAFAKCKEHMQNSKAPNEKIFRTGIFTENEVPLTLKEIKYKKLKEQLNGAVIRVVTMEVR